MGIEAQKENWGEGGVGPHVTFLAHSSLQVASPSTSV